MECLLSPFPGIKIGISQKDVFVDWSQQCCKMQFPGEEKLGVLSTTESMFIGSFNSFISSHRIKWLLSHFPEQNNSSWSWAGLPEKKPSFAQSTDHVSILTSYMFSLILITRDTNESCRRVEENSLFINITVLSLIASRLLLSSLTRLLRIWTGCTRVYQTSTKYDGPLDRRHRLWRGRKHVHVDRSPSGHPLSLNIKEVKYSPFMPIGLHREHSM